MDRSDNTEDNITMDNITTITSEMVAALEQEVVDITALISDGATDSFTAVADHLVTLWTTVEPIYAVLNARWLDNATKNKGKANLTPAQFQSALEMVSPIKFDDKLPIESVMASQYDSATERVAYAAAEKSFVSIGGYLLHLRKIGRKARATSSTRVGLTDAQKATLAAQMVGGENGAGYDLSGFVPDNATAEVEYSILLGVMNDTAVRLAQLDKVLGDDAVKGIKTTFGKAKAKLAKIA